MEALHAQRVEWKKQRAVLEPLGVYQDFRAVFTEESVPRAEMIRAAKDAEVQIVVSTATPGFEGGVLFISRPEGYSAVELAHFAPPEKLRWQKVAKRQKEWAEEVFGAATEPYPGAIADWDAALVKDAKFAYATVPVPPEGLVPRTVALRNTSTHVLAAALTPEQVAQSLLHGHSYVAHDWLCDPTGFRFLADNNLGVFEMGDEAGTGPAAGATTIRAMAPVEAELRLFRNGKMVAEKSGRSLEFPVKDEGAYRLEAWLKADGEKRPWIYSNPIYVRQPLDVRLPSADTPSSVEFHGDLAYVEGGGPKQKLDLYLPKNHANAPVLVFFHGGAWTTGDRTLYRAVGNRLARAGIAVAIPSYRLMPANPYPAQIEDAAAALAWVYRNITQYGANRQKLYLAGHSAGGHLASLLALDAKYLAKYELNPQLIRGVISMSGIYDVRAIAAFRAQGEDASPLFHVHGSAARFLVSYVQWDYLGLPKQAREFTGALKKAFVDAKLIYIPRDNHLTEIIHLAGEQSRLLDAILGFLEE